VTTQLTHAEPSLKVDDDNVYNRRKHVHEARLSTFPVTFKNLCPLIFHCFDTGGSVTGRAPQLLKNLPQHLLLRRAKPINPGSPEKWPLKQSVCVCVKKNIRAVLLQYTLCPQKSEPPKHFVITAANLHRFK